MTVDATFQVVEARDGTFRWRLRTADGAVLATSDAGYDTRQAAMRGIQQVKRTAPEAGVESDLEPA